MNIQEYISSGIIEQYIIGDVSLQEKQEVECMSHIYPEIKAELEKVQFALESYALANAVEVPAHIKKKIFTEIDALPQERNITKEETPVAKVYAMQPRFNKYLAAASVIFIVALSAVYLLMNTKNSELTAKLNTLTKQSDTAQNQLKQTTDALAIVSDANNKLFVLQGNEKALGKQLNVLWNKNTGQVYVNNVQLPATTSDKQYQLWALKDGKPIDLGVFNTETSLQNMKTIIGAQAFAVTLEKKGGSPQPNLAELRAILNI